MSPRKKGNGCSIERSHDPTVCWANGKASEVEFQDDNKREGWKAVDESAGRSASEVLTEEEELRIWKQEGYDDLPWTMTLSVVDSYLGVSRSTAYNMRKDGTIRTLQFRGRYLVTRRELFRLLHPPQAQSALA